MITEELSEFALMKAIQWVSCIGNTVSSSLGLNQNPPKLSFQSYLPITGISTFLHTLDIVSFTENDKNTSGMDGGAG